LRPYLPGMGWRRPGWVEDANKKSWRWRT
jgi:hypothetical protein